MKAVIDIETGGFLIEEDAIVEIALLIFDEEMNIKEEYSAIVAPYQKIGSEQFTNHSADAEAVHGITLKQREEEGKSPTEICDEIEEILFEREVSVFIGHNIDKFDMPRIQHFFDQFSMFEVPFAGIGTFDTLLVSRLKLCLEHYNLSAMCNHFGIETTGAHRAMNDCRATFELYKHLIKLP